MTAAATALWIANVALNTAGQLALKSAAAAPAKAGLARWTALGRRPSLWFGLTCFVLEFATWFALLSLIPLSQAMLIASINIVAVMIGGRVVFRDRLDPARIAAMSLIAIGVALAGGSA